MCPAVATFSGCGQLWAATQVTLGLQHRSLYDPCAIFVCASLLLNRMFTQNPVPHDVACELWPAM